MIKSTNRYKVFTSLSTRWRRQALRADKAIWARSEFLASPPVRVTHARLRCLGGFRN